MFLFTFSIKKPQRNNKKKIDQQPQTKTFFTFDIASQFSVYSLSYVAFENG